MWIEDYEILVCTLYANLRERALLQTNIVFFHTTYGNEKPFRNWRFILYRNIGAPDHTPALALQMLKIERFELIV